MKAITPFVLFALLGASVPAQAVLFAGNGAGSPPPGIGAPQTIPDPFDATAPSGTIELFVDLCFGPSLYAYATGVPQGYNHGSITQETLAFLLNVGNASTPGVTIAMGDFFIPLTPDPISIVIGPSTYIGPVGCGTGAGTFGGTLNGAFLDMTSLIPATFQGTNLSMQAVLLDTVVNRVFTSNAVNFQI